MCAASATVSFGQHRTQLSSLLRHADSEIASIVRENLPKGYFTTINVNSVTYKFAGFHEKDAKAFSLKVAKVAYVSSWFFAVTGALGITNDDAYSTHVNPESLKKELVSMMVKNEDGRTEFEKAYYQCSHIDLYIAKDLEAFELNLRSSNFILYTYKGVKVTADTAKLVLGILGTVAMLQGGGSGNNGQSVASG